MISLEEAFVNLGLNPEKMFEEQPDEAQPKELDSPQSKDENLPQSFSRGNEINDFLFVSLRRKITII